MVPPCWSTIFIVANHGQGCHYCRKVSALPKVQLCTFCTFVRLNLSSINAQCPIIFIQSASTNMSCDHQKSPLYQTKDFSRLLIWFLRLTRAELCPKSVPQIVAFESLNLTKKNSNTVLITFASILDALWKAPLTGSCSNQFCERPRILTDT